MTVVAAAATAAATAAAVVVVVVVVVEETAESIGTGRGTVSAWFLSIVVVATSSGE